MKAILDNLPNTISKVYIFGSSIRIDCAVDSDLDVFLIGTLSNDELNRIMRAIPEGERLDILVETEEEFLRNLQDNYSSLYKKVYEGGYKIYDKKSK